MAEKTTAPRELLITVPGDGYLSDSTTELTKMSPRCGPGPGKPPKIPVSDETLTRRRSLARSMYSKPRSRFGEQPLLVDASVLEEDNLANIQEHISRNSSMRRSLSRGSHNSKSGYSAIRTNSIAHRTALGLSGHVHDHDDDDDVEDVVKRVQSLKEKKKKLGFKVVLQWIVFLSLLGCLVASLKVQKMKEYMIWGLELWKWCVLVLVIFSGMMVTTWFMNFVVFLIERNYLLRKKVLYFVYGLKKSVQVFVWIGLVLLAWGLLFDCETERSKKAKKFLHCVTWTLAALLIGSFLWMIKTLLLKILACSFHVNTFFDRIQESIFHQYVLQTLSGPPVIEEAEKVGKSTSTGQLSLRSSKKGKKNEKKVIDMEKLYTMKQEKVSAGTMKTLVDAITNSRLCTLSDALEESVNGNTRAYDNEIHNEMEAIAAAYHIFNNVAKPGSKYIDEEDFHRFMISEEVDLVFPLFEASENGQIDRKSLTDWVVKVYNGRKALAHALCDTKTAVKQLNKVVLGVLIAVTIFIWILLLEIADSKSLWYIVTQLLVIAFMMKKTCTTVFEALMFVFVAHPFDVGDRCVVDGMILLVEEMNILTTVFLKLDNEKVYYPNAVLATKPISNFYRSPDMGEAIEFSIDFATSMEKIGLLKEKIKQYLENNPQHWYAGHGFVVKEIENVNKLKMAIYCSQTINFQDWPVKSGRRSDFVFALKTMLEELEIKYYLPPQQIHVRHIGSDAAIASKF
ncbi:mechanosensitive ion channel protein 10-like [Mercurialis annua]|uniref:mechanosensitive ion channel protein 10-like n=1 Tax=Mercurialis annua TaxID=3986 RepID=UPI00216069E8|nr:mechanosensitive ion channel protein 10-like [Mercurialis annua]